MLLSTSRKTECPIQESPSHTRLQKLRFLNRVFDCSRNKTVVQRSLLYSSTLSPPVLAAPSAHPLAFANHALCPSRERDPIASLSRLDPHSIGLWPTKRSWFANPCSRLHRSIPYCLCLHLFPSHLCYFALRSPVGSAPIGVHSLHCILWGVLHFLGLTSPTF